jgi:hypothetical protein
MKRCWLHIGMPKTGSSSIQNNLGAVNNPKGWRLLKVGGKSNMGIPLYAMFHEKPHHLHWFVKQGKTASEIEEMGLKLRQELAQKLENSEASCTIISAELLWVFSLKSLHKLKLFLSPFFDEIQVIGYIRSPISFYNSILQQQFKSGKSDLMISRLKINYRSRVEKFDEVFGLSSVGLVKFQPSSFPNQCIVEDFCERLAIKLPKNTLGVRSNESLSREACGLLYAYRKFGPGYGVGPDAIKENTFIIRPLRFLKGRKFTISKSLLDRMDLPDESDTQWIEQRIGDSLHENYYDSEHTILSEEQLLIIKRETLVEFSELFTLLWRIPVPGIIIPLGIIIGPVEAANFIHQCRELAVANLKKKRAQKRKHPILSALRSCLNLRELWGRSCGRKNQKDRRK